MNFESKEIYLLIKSLILVLLWIFRAKIGMWFTTASASTPRTSAIIRKSEWSDSSSSGSMHNICRKSVYWRKSSGCCYAGVGWIAAWNGKITIWKGWKEDKNSNVFSCPMTLNQSCWKCLNLTSLMTRTTLTLSMHCRTLIIKICSKFSTSSSRIPLGRCFTLLSTHVRSDSKAFLDWKWRSATWK